MDAIILSLIGVSIAYFVRKLESLDLKLDLLDKDVAIIKSSMPKRKEERL